MESSRAIAKDDRDNHDITDCIEKLPKVELHAHLNGCIRDETLFDLARERGVTLSTHHFAAPHHDSNKNRQSSLYNVRPRSLQDCFDMFAEIPSCVNDLAALTRITTEAVEDFCAHQVVYLELRSTPKRLLQSHGNPQVASKRDYIETILKVLRKFESAEKERYDRERRRADGDGSQQLTAAHLPMTCRFLVSVDRSQSFQEGQENVELAIDFFRQTDSFVVGVDLGGNPTKHDFRLFEPLFVQARTAGLKITLHCGEISCINPAPHAEAAAILSFRPDRIGHALLLPPDLQEMLQSRRIPIETCPTSNVMTLELAKRTNGSLLHGLQQHPALEHWLKMSHPLTVATDDPGVFDTTATKELQLLAAAFGLSRDKIAQLVSQSMDYAFCESNTKMRVKHMIDERLGLAGR